MPRDTHDEPENEKIDESLTDHKHSCRLSLRHHGMRLFLLFHPVTHLAMNFETSWEEWFIKVMIGCYGILQNEAVREYDLSVFLLYGFIIVRPGLMI